MKNYYFFSTSDPLAVFCKSVLPFIRFTKRERNVIIRSSLQTTESLSPHARRAQSIYPPSTLLSRCSIREEEIHFKSQNENQRTAKEPKEAGKHRAGRLKRIEKKRKHAQQKQATTRTTKKRKGKTKHVQVHRSGRKCRSGRGGQGRKCRSCSRTD